MEDIIGAFWNAYPRNFVRSCCEHVLDAYESEHRRLEDAGYDLRIRQGCQGHSRRSLIQQLMLSNQHAFEGISVEIVPAVGGGTHYVQAISTRVKPHWRLTLSAVQKPREYPRGASFRHIFARQARATGQTSLFDVSSEDLPEGTFYAMLLYGPSSPGFTRALRTERQEKLWRSLSSRPRFMRVMFPDGDSNQFLDQYIDLNAEFGSKGIAIPEEQIPEREPQLRPAAQRSAPSDTDT